MKIEVTQEVLKKWGVYKITNIISGKFYIGSTIESFKKRLSKHISCYSLWSIGLRDTCDCPILYNALKKYGVDNFKFEILRCFEKKKESKICNKIANYLEEKYINSLSPEYNICRLPTLSGCPNLGRKLSQEWKDAIASKSKLYKHSNNQNIYLNKKQQNKDLSSIYEVTKGGKVFKGSAVDCSQHLNISLPIFYSPSSKKKYRIVKIKSQKKKIKISDGKDVKIFNSFGECDRFLNMWRGFTSTQVVNKKDRILGYKYELL